MKGPMFSVALAAWLATIVAVRPAVQPPVPSALDPATAARIDDYMQAQRKVNVDAEITFVKDASGAVNTLILRQGGPDRPARRMP
jgi:hypothetical protein